MFFAVFSEFLVFSEVFSNSFFSAVFSGSFVKMASVVPIGFEVAVDSKLSSRRVMHDRKHIN